MRTVLPPRTRHLKRANAGVLMALVVTSACSMDWDHLDPSLGASASGGAAQSGGADSGGSVGSGGEASGGADAGGAGGSNTAGASGSGSTGSGGAPAPTCSGSVLANTSFEQMNGANFRSWELTKDSGAIVAWAGETALVHPGDGARALRLDTRPALATSIPRAALVSSATVALATATEVTATVMVRVEQLAPERELDVLALFDTGAANPTEVELATLDATTDYVRVGKVIDVPENATTVRLAVSSPDGALVYLDGACASLD